MTIETTTRLAGPASGNGATTAFAFGFKVFATSDLTVFTRTSGVEDTKTLGTDYSVTLNADQDSDPGGTVTFTTAPASGTSVFIESAVPYTQGVALSNAGGFYPDVLNAALDRQTAFSQQIKSLVDRGLRLRAGDAALPVMARSNFEEALPYLNSSGAWASFPISGVAAILNALDDFSEIADALADGTIGALVTHRVQPTVAAMKALDADTLTPGTLVLTLGHTNAGLGGAVYRVLEGAASANSLTVNNVTVLENDDGDRTLVIDHEGPVRLSWAGALSDGTTDDSAAFAAAISTGKTIAIPSGRNTIIGTGTNPLPALVSFQSIVSDNPAPVWNATLTLQQSLIVGNTTTRSDENGIGPGVRLVGSENVTLFNLIYNRKFVLAEGVRCNGVHRLAVLGNASAAGPSYVFYNFADIAQRYAHVVLSGVSGTYTASETVTGGTSGATALVESWDAGSGKLTLRVVSSTLFQASETVTGGSSGATGTVTSTYRPTHLIQVANHAGDFISKATVEGAYCGNANGIDVSNNAHVRFDEFRIEKYWGRFQVGFDSINARSVNGQLYADMEGCLLNTARFYTTSATVRPADEVGFANIYGRVKASVLAGGDCAFQFRLDRTGIESETVNLQIQTTDEHAVHGARLICSAGTMDNMSIAVRGSMIPAAANKYGVDIQQSSTGAINAIDIDTNVAQAGATAVGANVYISGTAISGRIRKPVNSGNVTRKISFNNTPPVGLHFDVSESGIPLGGAQKSEPFYLENIPTGSATTYLKRGGLVTSWTVDRDIRITRAFAQYEGTPTANHLSFIIEVDASNAKTEANTGVTYQGVNYWPSNTLFVARGSVIKLKVTGTASYASSGVDVVGWFEYQELWNDA